MKAHRIGLALTLAVIAEGSARSVGAQMPTASVAVTFDALPADRSPDTALAVSDSTVLVGRNSTIGLFSKRGESVASLSIGQFFASVLQPGEAFLTDPHGVFDPLSGRFFFVNRSAGADRACAPGACLSRILLAVSKTSSPRTLGSADWYFQSLDRTLLKGADGRERYEADFGDFDHVGVTEEFVLIGWQAVSDSPTGRTGQGGRLRVLEKAPLLLGVKVESWIDWEMDERPRPALVQFGTPWLFSDIQTRCEGGRAVWKIAGLLNARAAPELLVRGLATNLGCGPSQVEAPQAGGPPIDVVHWTATPYLSGTSLWVVESMTSSDHGRLVLNWAEFDVGPWPDAVLKQQGVIDVPDLWLYTPSIAADRSGNAVIVFNASGPAMRPSVLFAYRRGGDAAGVFQAPDTLKAGLAAYTFIDNNRNRLVDYPGIAIDPVDGSFWIGGAYAAESARSRSAIGRFSLPGAAPTTRR